MWRHSFSSSCFFGSLGCQGTELFSLQSSVSTSHLWLSGIGRESLSTLLRVPDFPSLARYVLCKGSDPLTRDGARKLMRPSPGERHPRRSLDKQTQPRFCLTPGTCRHDPPPRRAQLPPG